MVLLCLGAAACGAYIQPANMTGEGSAALPTNANDSTQVANGNGTVVASTGNGNAAGAAGSNGNVSNTGAANLSATPLPSSTLPSGVLALAMSGCCVADYFTKATVAGNTYSLLLDSGSTTTALAASTCTSCAGADTYNVAHGTQTAYTANSNYAGGSSWSGKVYTDTLAFGTASSPATVAVGTNFVAITQSSDFFFTGSCGASNDVLFDGILGLGPNALLRTGTSSFYSALASPTSGQNLPADIFSIKTCGVGGTLWLGGYDPGIVAATPFYTPFVTSGTASKYYGVNVADMQLGGVSLALSANDLGPMVVDSGTGGLLLTQNAYDALVAKLKQTPAFTNNFNSTFFEDGVCPMPKQGSNLSTLDGQLPTLTFSFPVASGGTAKATLTATGSYLLPVRDDANHIYYCPQVHVVPTGVPPLFGNAAMRQHVVIFDRANKRLGLAPHKTCPDTVALGT